MGGYGLRLLSAKGADGLSTKGADGLSAKGADGLSAKGAGGLSAKGADGLSAKKQQAIRKTLKDLGRFIKNSRRSGRPWKGQVTFYQKATGDQEGWMG